MRKKALAIKAAGLLAVLILLVILVSGGLPAMAKGKGQGRQHHGQRAESGHHQMPPVDNPLYQDQCGACHFAYQPGLLPAGSWTRLLAKPQDHFGQDLPISPEDREAICRYLEANAAERCPTRLAGRIVRCLAGQTPLRISQVPYIQRKHAGHVPAEVLQRESVGGSLANCAACHTRAAQGVYDHAYVRIPAQ